MKITKHETGIDGVDIWTGWLDDDENWDEFEQAAKEHFNDPEPIVDVYDMMVQ